ncbi:MAG: ABC transporter permease [Actinomycetota bacterium]|nr:ABC transporter permease [Actinomycetota bacterium]
MSTHVSDTAELALPGGAPLADPQAPHRWRAAVRKYLRHPAGMVGLVLTLLVVVAGTLADVISPGDPFRTVADPLLEPSSRHWMGTDNLGRDVFDAVVHGARTSMIIVAGVVAIASVIGLTVGVVAGYRGGWVDDLLMRVTELFQAVPRFFLVLLIVALFGAGLDNLIYVLAFTSWPTLARVSRSEVLSVRDRVFVEAARSIGATGRRIVFRHVLPNVLPTAMVVIALTGSRIIILEASLSFLGLGDPEVMSWGYLVSNAQRFLRVAWWMSVFPGLAIAVAVLGINLMSDALNDILATYSGGGRPRRQRGLRRRWARRADPTVAPAPVATV